MTYEVEANIYKSRKDHKQDEWKKHTKDDNAIIAGFCDWLDLLPCNELFH